ncbi:cation diffusion facilitator family transporter [Chloroherpeton thalassium ATCC 35110]|uniref:Cation diffusion facilitator family transporter n=1 Tax=Chloroherpeton thalassium (strain ATCC 35110 / GB-78) TaxID=517418 RepID=B3QVY9_CHLT3|nr:cation diffusion facilitator family transporter [Chloroherpeton thalassium]ACF14643.1 cation diffusion facilitator family transporter [Chloroherpeton thalassium ATCC 35110]
MEHNYRIHLEKLKRNRKARKGLGFASILTITIFFAEVIGGWLSGSLALMADAGHMATDILSLAISYAAAVIAQKPATPNRSYGHYRVEILAALVNGLLLVLIATYICFEAYERLHIVREINAAEMFGFGIVGLLANIISAFFLYKSQGESVNIKAAYIHVLSDLLGSVAVILGAIGIFFTGFTILDPILSFIISLLILKSAWEIIVESVDILLEGVPRNIDISRIESSLRSLSHIKDLHDLHVWAITSGVNALSCHVLIDDYTNSREILLGINKMLKEKYDIDHITIQLEDSHVNEFVVSKRGASENQYHKHWYH